MTSWHSYPKIYNLGHSALAELLLDPVLVEEKIDGSQFSFGRFGEELKIRSKGQQMIADAPEAMFRDAVNTAKQLFNTLKDGWTYRAEYLRIPKHNALAYDRIPSRHLILFDINSGEEKYLSYDEKKTEAERLCLEIVPIIYHGIISSPDHIFGMMDRVSILGGQKIEGLVIKNYLRFGSDKKALLGKHVSESFKEVHKNDWKKSNPASSDVLLYLCDQYRSKARWNKAIQHLREKGEIEDSPRDIGKLLKEVQIDVKSECESEIKDALFKWAIPHIMRGAIKGLPEWYKDQLVGKQFENPKEAS